jgi:Zn-finger nucleic acid-binding protein
MKCPECNRQMNSKQLGDVSIDECPQCRGIWFDPGEIDEVKESLSPDLRWMDFEQWRKNAEFKVAFDPLYCPRCETIPMTTIAEKQSGTSVRTCSNCKGSWLNAGDLSNVINSLYTEAENTTSAEYLKESLKQAGELLSAKGDPISEWKDLKTVLRLLKYRFFAEHPRLNSMLVGLQNSLPL